MKLLITMLALMPAVAFLMPLSINDANTQPVDAVAKSRLDAVIPATNEVLHARTPPADLSDLPYDLAVLEEMAKKHDGIAKKAEARIEKLRNGLTAPLSANEYLQIAKNARDHIARIEQRMKQVVNGQA